MPPTPHPIRQVGVVGVPVSDQDRALAFYVEALGFEKGRDVPFGPQRWLEVAPPAATTSLALQAAPDEVGVDTRIRLFTPDADAVHADLRARGVDVDREVLRFGAGVPPMFRLRDPDGNELTIVEA